MLLVDFIKANAVRGACMCGQCVDAPLNPEKHQPIGHTADVQFFKVALRDPNADKEKLRDELVEILKSHEGEFIQMDLLDGEEHNFMQIGGYVGDQGFALTLMGLGKILGLWELCTPNSLMPFLGDDDAVIKIKMAGMGMVSIKKMI